VSQFRDYPWDNVAGFIAWLRQEKEKGGIVITVRKNRKSAQGRTHEGSQFNGERRQSQLKKGR
jgi:hypothetical protein